MKKGDIGVGFLVMIIAIVVIAAIIAGAILTTTDLLGQKSMVTGAAARKKLTNNYLIDYVKGTSTENRFLDRFFMRISLTPGSDPGFMNLTSITDISPDASAEHWFKQDAECINDAINGFFLFNSDPILPIYEPFPDELSRAFDFSPAQTSEFMMGKVVIALVFPESRGTVDPNTENWDRFTQDAIISEMSDAMNWWRAREPRAGLEFAYVVQRDIITDYEPITRALTEANKELWVSQVLDRMDVKSGTDVVSRSRDYANDLRKEYNAHWAFIVYFVNNQNDADGQFPGSHPVGHSYLNGPYMIIPAGKTINVAPLLAHEIGHIFGAGDQYVTSSCNCTDRFGYLGIQNQNCNNPLDQNKCRLNESSIMGNDVRDANAYAQGQVDKYARAQMGLIDINENDLLDPWEEHYRGMSIIDSQLNDLEFSEYIVFHEGKGFYGLEHPIGHQGSYGEIEPGDSVSLCYEPAEPIEAHDYYEIHVQPAKGQHATAQLEMPSTIPKGENLMVYEAFK